MENTVLQHSMQMLKNIKTLNYESKYENKCFGHKAQKLLNKLARRPRTVRNKIVDRTYFKNLVWLGLVGIKNHNGASRSQIYLRPLGRELLHYYRSHYPSGTKRQMWRTAKALVGAAIMAATGIGIIYMFVWMNMGPLDQEIGRIFIGDCSIFMILAAGTIASSYFDVSNLRYRKNITLPVALNFFEDKVPEETYYIDRQILFDDDAHVINWPKRSDPFSPHRA